MAMAMTLGSISKSSSSWLPLKTMINIQNKKWAFNTLACCSTSSSKSRKQLILYSKPGCCLCDGLKEKLHAAFSLSSTDPSLSLQDVHLQVQKVFFFPLLLLYLIAWFCCDFVCLCVFVDKGYYYKCRVGEGLRVWDSSSCESQSWWHWGLLFKHFWGFKIVHFCFSSSLCLH